MMTRTSAKWLAGCSIVLACLGLYSTFCFGAGPVTPQVNAGPGIKKQVEQELGTLAMEIRRKASLSKEAAFVLLSGYLRSNPHVYGTAFAFAPRKKGGKVQKSSPYVYRSGEQLINKDLIESYDYTIQQWYEVPVKQQKAVWSEPYYDEGGGDAWMITYSIPIYSSGKQPRLIGVVTSDVTVPNPSQ